MSPTQPQTIHGASSANADLASESVSGTGDRTGTNHEGKTHAVH